MKNITVSCGCGKHNPLHCIIPPYIFKELSKSSDLKIREMAIQNLEIGTEFRTERNWVSPEMVSNLMTRSKGKFREVYDMQNKTRFEQNLPGKFVRSEGSPASNDNSVDEAYDGAGHVYDFYKQIFNRDSLDNNGLPLISSVRIGGMSTTNAFWNGRQMGYGDGDGMIFNRFTSSLDVIGHEFTHGVISFTSRLEYRNESGAINEHLADVFGVLIKQWVYNHDVNQANWLVGEDIIIQASTRRAIRNMLNPGTAFKNDPYLGSDPQPDHLNKKYIGSDDYGGVHINSGILNKAFAEASIKIGGYAWKQAGNIWYKAMLQLNNTSDFKDFVSLTASICVAEYGVNSPEHAAVMYGWKKVGL